ncbi:MAG: hypothetical protein E6J82_08680 [Deltaproteobacteria bacterium]|nr:MAG: hypothetical protein E6J82_08680 [Deltaproteobacteria bacterium]
MIRLAYLCAYALVAALGEALVARPASLWLRSQGLFHPALAWEVPYGSLLAASAAALALFTVWLGSHTAMGRKPVLPLHVAFLLLVGICLALRSASGEPRPPPDPAPALVSALAAAAAELDRSYASLYASDAAQFASSLAQIAAPPFLRLGRRIPLHARILSAAEGAQLEPLPDDQPGTLYIAILAHGTVAERDPRAPSREPGNRRSARRDPLRTWRRSEDPLLYACAFRKMMAVDPQR